ncbi:hypothetical protein BH23THE1_BH23THE1_34970 [soil metagenome]
MIRKIQIIQHSATVFNLYSRRKLNDIHYFEISTNSLRLLFLLSETSIKLTPDNNLQ